MNGARTNETNNYAENYIALLGALNNEIAYIVQAIKKAMSEV